jgi:cell division transport system permease protein
VIAVWIDRIKGDPEAARIVPPSGFDARLTVFCSAVMAFLAIFALSLALAAGRQADQWAGALDGAATVQIAAGENSAADLLTVMRILESTKGVAHAQPLDPAEQQALLTPWLGESAVLEGLALPQLIAVSAEAGGIDAQGLRLRLAAEVPNAVFDDHAAWRRPLVKSANRLWFLGGLSAILIAAAMAAVVTLAAQAALAANAGVIGVLRLVGATDRYIENAFVRRFALRALLGAGAGAILGALALMLVPNGTTEGIGASVRLEGWGWSLLLWVPLIAAGVALVATIFAARRALRGLT